MEDWRCGGPHLCTIPVKSIRFAEAHPLYSVIEAYGQPLTQGASTILKKANMAIQSIVNCLRQSVIDPEAEPAPTVSITVIKQQHEERWIEVCCEIRNLLRFEGLAVVSMELSDQRAFLEEKYYPINKIDKIFQVWDIVLARIPNSCDIRAWNSVGVYRVGQNSSQNTPTVLVTIKKSSHNRLPGQEAIVKIFNEFDLPMVSVKMIQPEIFHAGTYSSKYVRLSMSTGKASLGQSVVPHGFKRGAGTLGGYVEVFDG